MTRAWLRTLRPHFIPLVFFVIAIGSLALPVLSIYYPTTPTFGNPLFNYIEGALLLLLGGANELVIRTDRLREQQYEEQKSALEDLFSDYDD